MLGFVLLTHRALAHHVLHPLLHVGEVEVAPEPMQGALDALVAVLMDRPHDFLEQQGGGRDVQPPGEVNHAVDETPKVPGGTLP